jgi:hypothetical protein
MKWLVVLLFAPTLVVAQSASEVELTAEPHHHLVFSNSQVRVFNAEVPPHSETLMHWHRHDYIYVALGESQVVNTAKGKSPVTLTLHDGDTSFAAGGFAHVSKNVLDHPLRMVLIELLQDEKLRRLPSREGERALEILHGGTEEVLWVKDGVRASEVELQPGGMLPAGRHDEMLVALTDFELDSMGAGRSETVALKRGDSKWIPKPPEMTNSSNQPAKFVMLELP